MPNTPPRDMFSVQDFGKSEQDILLSIIHVEQFRASHVKYTETVLWLTPFTERDDETYR